MVTSPPASSPAARTAAAGHLPCHWVADPRGPAAVAGKGPGWLASGPVEPPGPACLSLWHGIWVDNRVYLAVLSMKFKRISKMIFSEFYLNALENVWVLKFAPNLLKQILLGSLSPGLLEKIIACHF